MFLNSRLANIDNNILYQNNQHIVKDVHIIDTIGQHNSISSIKPQDNLQDYIATNYILSLSKKTRLVFSYLMRFTYRGTFTEYISEIMAATGCSRKTIERATNKFHNDGVITKFQVYSCFDVNQFTINHKKIYELDKSILREMTHINININSLFINSFSQYSINSYATHTNTAYTNTNYIYPNSNSLSTTGKIIRHKKEEKSMNNEIFNKHNIKVTAHGEIYFKYMPETAIEFALGSLRSATGIKNPTRFVCSEIRKYLTANKLTVDWTSYFREMERAGVDKNSDVLENTALTENKTELKKKIEILTATAVDPESELKGKLSRVRKMIELGKSKIGAIELIAKERKLTPFEESELNFEYGHLRQRNAMEIKYKSQLTENRSMRNENEAADVCQAEKDYRALYLKMDRDSNELNKWKWMIDNLDREFTPALREQTAIMATANISKLTKSLAKDIDTLNELDEKRKLKAQAPVSDNFQQEDVFGDEIH